MTDTVTLYPAPAGIAASDRFAVTVNGASSFTYLTTGPAKAYYTAGHTASWTSFDVNGPCEIHIRRRMIRTWSGSVPASTRSASTIRSKQRQLAAARDCGL
jgi:hypothetical protein